MGKVKVSLNYVKNTPGVDKNLYEMKMKIIMITFEQELVWSARSYGSGSLWKTGDMVIWFKKEHTSCWAIDAFGREGDFNAGRNVSFNSTHGAWPIKGTLFHWTLGGDEWHGVGCEMMNASGLVTARFYTTHFVIERWRELPVGQGSLSPNASRSPLCLKTFMLRARQS